MSKLPLEGMRVVDFTQIQVGPQATLWLAVLGAEVIRIESHRRPDLLRMYAQLRDSKVEPSLNKSAVFNSLNFGKKSCTLNLTQPRAVELVKELVKISDVVVENFATGVIERLGLGYPILKEINPSIIMLSLSGFGRTGPEKDYVAYAPIIHAFSGLASLTGYQEGPPISVLGSFWADVVGAQAGAFAVMAALYHRSVTGEGQYLDVSMTEATLSILPEAVMDYTINHRVQGRKGNRDDSMAPHGCYRCRGNDKWISLAVSNNEEWQSLCEVMGYPQWSKEERFNDQLSRWHNQDELDNLIQEWTIHYTPHELMHMLQNAGVAAGPSVDVSEVVNDPHLNEREFFVEIDHPEMGKELLTRLPGKPIPNPTGNYQPAPLFGQHNDYVLHELLGLPEDEIARLIDEGIVY